MTIPAFTKRASLSVDTVRFYVHRRLLDPEVGTCRCRNHYQVFYAVDVNAATNIPAFQAVGLSLREIAAFLADFRDTRLNNDDLIADLTSQ